MQPLTTSGGRLAILPAKQMQQVAQQEMPRTGPTRTRPSRALPLTPPLSQLVRELGLRIHCKLHPHVLLCCKHAGWQHLNGAFFRWGLID